MENRMKKFNLNKTVLVVEVPYNYESAIIEDNSLTIWQKNKLGSWVGYEDLPAGNWQILSIAKDMTEEILEKADFLEKEVEILDWPENTDIPNVKEITRLESFRSWMQSENIKDNDLILIKEKA